MRLIAHEFFTRLKCSITVDWAHRESARNRMRVLVERILRKYGYPPDLQGSAIQMVLQQAEAFVGAVGRIEAYQSNRLQAFSSHHAQNSYENAMNSLRCAMNHTKYISDSSTNGGACFCFTPCNLASYRPPHH